MHEPHDTNRHIAQNLEAYKEVEVREVPLRHDFWLEWLKRASAHGPDAFVAVSVLIAMVATGGLTGGSCAAMLVVGIVGVMLMICLWIKEVHRGPSPPRRPP